MSMLLSSTKDRGFYITNYEQEPYLFSIDLIKICPDGQDKDVEEFLHFLAERIQSNHWPVKISFKKFPEPDQACIKPHKGGPMNILNPHHQSQLIYIMSIEARASNPKSSAAEIPSRLVIKEAIEKITFPNDMEILLCEKINSTFFITIFYSISIYDKPTAIKLFTSITPMLESTFGRHGLFMADSQIKAYSEDPLGLSLS